MLKFTTLLKKFGKLGEKTGWTYFEISAAQAKTLNPGIKVSYRVKGKLDAHPIAKAAILPMGKGMFIFPVKGDLRKALGKQAGDKVTVVLELDESKFIFSPDLMKCLKDDPEAYKFFKSLPGSHQKYFSKWIDGAKTAHTKTRRIVTAMMAFSKKHGYGEMMRAYRSYEL